MTISELIKKRQFKPDPEKGRLDALISALEKLEGINLEEKTRALLQQAVDKLNDLLSMKEEITPQKGVHYFDGQDGEQGEKGDEPSEEKLVSLIKPLIPKVRNGQDGKDADEEKILKKLLKEIPKGQTMDDIILSLKNAKLSSDMIDGLLTEKDFEKHLKKGKYATHRDLQRLQEVVMLNYGGHGGSGKSSVNAVFNEVVSGSGTSFTLANTPTSGTVIVFGLGQRLTPTTDYTISGANITTISSWNAGEIISDYQY
jgi:hypothetical protein